jgi:hypothetical protein
VHRQLVSRSRPLATIFSAPTSFLICCFLSNE